jgi:dipeptidyl aminopeptidase/acylaminoacyl peptidase
VNLKGNGFTRLTEARGQHEIRIAPSRQFFLDTHSSVDRPPAVELRRADGELLQTLAIADVAGLEELLWTSPAEFVVKAADGKTDLYGVLYKPFDFDPGKQYPVILRSHRAERTFLGSGERETAPVWPQALAQLGFITFEVDVREPALSWRGGEFDRVTAGTIGRYEVSDYVATLTGLAAERPYMDLSRVGVFGGSYGGYHAIRALLQAPEVFHVGVAVAAITDSYGHPNFYVLGSPEGNEEAFEEASNLSLAGNLRGKLLLVHGTHDTSVPFSHAMKMADALTRAGKPYDLLVLPGWGHWYPDTEQWERYRLEAYRRYFEEHLNP